VQLQSVNPEGFLSKPAPQGQPLRDHGEHHYRSRHTSHNKNTALHKSNATGRDRAPQAVSLLLSRDREKDR
jgi:hypothetical protein